MTKRNGFAWVSCRVALLRFPCSAQSRTDGDINLGSHTIHHSRPFVTTVAGRIRQAEVDVCKFISD